MKFSEMKIKPEIVERLAKVGFIDATDVQAEAIPILLEGKDLIVRAKTGTGKTLAFIVPIFQMIDKHKEGVKVLILAPTRELALQITSMASKVISKELRILTVYGGVSINPQLNAIKNGIDIIVGTPGRIIDLIDRQSLNLDTISFLVLDECDIMLDMGFIDDVRFIMEKTPMKKQTMMFSATVSKELLKTSEEYMRDAKFISVGSDDMLTVNKITHLYSIASGIAKFHMLLGYIHDYNPKKAIIFVSTKIEADKVYSFLASQQFSVVLMHGGLTQAKRENSLNQFRNSHQFLIATNVASRGLDIPDISDIISFDAPEDTYTYIHRVGRSARMGKVGRAFTIISKKDISLIKGIAFQAGIQIKKIYIDTKNFENINVKHNFTTAKNFYRNINKKDRNFYKNKETTNIGNWKYKLSRR
ncbi:MAG: DEAD/DEAH box helicase [Candidatus Micrarchaeaceae archaeon]